MDSRWLNGSPNKEERKQEVLGYRNAFDALKEILQKHYKKKDACRDYLEAGWASKQIAINEYNQAIDDILNLITVDKEI